MLRLIACSALGVLTILGLFLKPATALDGATSSNDSRIVKTTPSIQIPTPPNDLIAAQSSSEVILLDTLKNWPDKPIQLTDSELAHIQGTGFDLCCGGGVCPVCFTRFTPPIVKPW
jgi:hypothetical protein